jgi:hypothetical protein
MELSSTEIAKKIPDWDELTKMTDNIAEVMLKKLLLEKQIKAEEAKIVYTATTDIQYALNSKAPAISFIEATYKYTGFKNELLPLRDEMALLTSELEKARNRYEIVKQMLDIWRTVSANERNAKL